MFIIPIPEDDNEIMWEGPRMRHQAVICANHADRCAEIQQYNWLRLFLFISRHVVCDFQGQGMGTMGSPQVFTLQAHKCIWLPAQPTHKAMHLHVGNQSSALAILMHNRQHMNDMQQAHTEFFITSLQHSDKHFGTRLRVTSTLQKYLHV